MELELDESELDGETAEALEHAMEGEGLSGLAELPSQGMGADEYQYDLVVRRGGEEVSLRFDETVLPPKLAPLVMLLERRAEGGTR